MRKEKNRTTRFRSALGSFAVLRENVASPFWLVVRSSRSSSGQLFPFRRYTALFAIGVPLKKDAKTF